MCSSETKPHPTRPILIFAIADASESPLVKTLYSKSVPVHEAAPAAAMLLSAKRAPVKSVPPPVGVHLRTWLSLPPPAARARQMKGSRAEAGSPDKRYEISLGRDEIS